MKDIKTGYTMTIDGQSVSAAKTMDVFNPSTGRVCAQAPAGSATDLDRAVAAAKSAFLKWRETPHDERSATLIRAGDVIEARAEELAPIFSMEHGRSLAGTKDEIQLAAKWARGLAKLKLPVEVIEDTPTRRIEVHHEPLGVVAAIVPWNFPILLAIWKISHAVLTGNTVVVKPSPFTPLTTLKIGEILMRVFPAGVVNVISGGDDLGPMMTSHPGFAKISFTGSSATGKRVMASAAAGLKRVTLELGGNDAAIVMPDVDVDAVAQQLFFGAFYNTAQVCVATKRLYIHDDIYDQLRDKLHALARASKVGPGSDADSVFGPIQNRPQFERVKNLLTDAKATGLKLLEGGPVPSEGYFVPLTLVDNPPEDSRVVVEEAFGPILPLLRFKNIDEVIDRANDTDYGLAGAVWSKDIDTAISIAHRLDTGTVWINQNLATTPATPLGGHKSSGVGVENGVQGLREYTQVKAIYIPKVAAPRVKASKTNEAAAAERVT